VYNASNETSKIGFSMQSYWAECGAPLVVKRPRKKFCSNRCKMKTFRREQSERLDHLESLVRKITANKPKVIHDLFA
jgi:hypothetical protein